MKCDWCRDKPLKYIYSPPCMCMYGNCWDEFLCEDCLAKLNLPEDKQKYVEVWKDKED